ncbi:unnamed protein product, partial [marine sediment metagenome]
MPFLEDFEGGEVLAEYWAVSGTNDFRTAPTTEHIAHGGSWHLGMDDAVYDLAYSRNELTLSVNLAGFQNVVLTFWAREFGDEPHGPPASPFTGGSDFDGVAVSEDGTTWYEARGLRNLSSTYEEIVIDLDAVAAAHGIYYTDAFRIRFNQYDNHPIASDGIAVDDIAITGETVLDPWNVWVDFGYAGMEVGSEPQPFNTLGEA